MPHPVRSLTVLQNWDCQGCSNCCRTYHVRVNDEEKTRILSHDWSDIIGDKLPVVYDRRIGGDRLNHGDDGVCVFLGKDNRCQIHAKYGSAAKPLACRLFPFMLIPAGDHWRVSMRFACPTVIVDQGQPISGHQSEIEEYRGLYESEIKRDISTDPPPPLQSGQVTTWPDLIRFALAASKLLENDKPFEFRMRMLLAYITMMRKSRFEKVTGKKLSEFLEIVTAAIEDDLQTDPQKMPKPGFVGRSLFRQVAAVYSRKDMGQDHGDLVSRGAMGRMAAAWRFAMGRGSLPTVHAAIPKQATFEHVETTRSKLSKIQQATLARYYRTKIESLQFCGRANFKLSVWDGLESLVLTYPVMMWLRRVISIQPFKNEDPLHTAMRIVDDNFGFNPLLGSFKQRMIVSAIRSKDELPKLVAWYGD